MEWAKQIVEWLRSGPRSLATFMIAGALVLLLSQHTVGAALLKDNFLRWVLVVFAMTVGGMAVYVVDRGAFWIRKKRKGKADEKQIIKRLANLTPREKELVKAFLIRNEPLEYQRRNPLVQVLKRDGIIRVVWQSSDQSDRVVDSFDIVDFARAHLRVTPEILKSVRDI